jgi:peptidyl-prolyl cis-trans isomerase B (cyclophilin B)
MLKFLLFLMMFTSASFLAFGQAPSATPAAKEPVKTNARPTPAPSAAKAEPFDKADVKTMAEKCVAFDTEAGVIEMEMFPEQAPESVRNFLNLAATGLFDTTVFGRVVPGFVIQGGDLYTREGKVTYEIGMRARRTLPDEPNKILHERGILSMARGEEANTAMTSFFILVGTGSHLDGKFAAFGRVTKGMEVVDAINKAEVREEKPDKPVRIKKATVRSCTPTS